MTMWIDQVYERTETMKTKHIYTFRTFCFSLNLTGMLNLTKIVHYHLSRMGK